MVHSYIHNVLHFMYTVALQPLCIMCAVAPFNSELCFNHSPTVITLLAPACLVISNIICNSFIIMINNDCLHQGSTWYRYVLYIATFFKDVDSFAKMVTNKDSLVYQTDLTQLSCLPILMT